MDSVLSKMLQPRIEALKVLVVDDDHYMRKVVRTMLNAHRREDRVRGAATAPRVSRRSGRTIPIL